MEEDIKNYFDTINLIKEEFELTKLQMAFRKAKMKKMMAYLREEER